MSSYNGSDVKLWISPEGKIIGPYSGGDYSHREIAREHEREIVRETPSTKAAFDAYNKYADEGPDEDDDDYYNEGEELEQNIEDAMMRAGWSHVEKEYGSTGWLIENTRNDPYTWDGIWTLCVALQKAGKGDEIVVCYLGRRQTKMTVDDIVELTVNESSSAFKSLVEMNDDLFAQGKRHALPGGWSLSPNPHKRDDGATWFLLTRGEVRYDLGVIIWGDEARLQIWNPEYDMKELVDRPDPSEAPGMRVFRALVPVLKSYFPGITKAGWARGGSSAKANRQGGAYGVSHTFESILGEVYAGEDDDRYDYAYPETPKPKIRETPTFQGDPSCFISPEGKIHWVPYFNHGEWAWETHREEVDNLVREGWIHISCERSAQGIRIDLPRADNADLDHLFDWSLAMGSHTGSIMSYKVYISNLGRGRRAVSSKYTVGQLLRGETEDVFESVIERAAFEPFIDKSVFLEIGMGKRTKSAKVIDIIGGSLHESVGSFRSILEDRLDEASPEGSFSAAIEESLLLLEADFDTTWRIYGPKIIESWVEMSEGWQDIRKTRSAEDIAEDVRSDFHIAVNQLDPTGLKYIYARWLAVFFARQDKWSGWNWWNNNSVGDLMLLRGWLSTYDMLKSRNKLPADKKDILKLSFTDLRDLADSPLAQEQKEKQVVRGMKLLHSDAHFTVYKVTTYEAALKLGRETKWCTAADSETGRKTCDNYLAKAPLYILIGSGGDKYQLHVEGGVYSIQLHDFLDNSVDAKRIVRAARASFEAIMAQDEKVASAFTPLLERLDALAQIQTSSGAHILWDSEREVLATLSGGLARQFLTAVTGVRYAGGDSAEVGASLSDEQICFWRKPDHWTLENPLVFNVGNTTRELAILPPDFLEHVYGDVDPYNLPGKGITTLSWRDAFILIAAYGVETAEKIAAGEFPEGRKGRDYYLSKATIFVCDKMKDYIKSAPKGNLGMIPLAKEDS